MEKFKSYGHFLNESRDWHNLDESKFGDWTRKMYNKGTEFSKSVIQGAKREGKETKEVIKILGRMMKGEKVSDNEKKFLKAQSADLAKILPLVAIQGIPAPVPITPFLIMLGKKYGFSVLPNSHSKISLEDLEKERE